MTIQSTAEYWSNVEKSALFSETVLMDLKQRFEDVSDAPLLARKLIDAGLLTDWQARFLLSGRHHLKVGVYVLYERLAGRGVGDRFLAIHPGLERKVEVHLFPAMVSEHHGLFQQFLDQASRVAGIDHPNLVHLYDIDQEADRYYFVYEHDTGTPLDRLPPGQLDAPRVADVTRQILSGLACAHQHQLVHGELNETEVRLDENNQVRVSNVGLATMIGQLGQSGNRYARQPLAEDDTSATGQLGLWLFEKHIGVPADSLQRELQRILLDLQRVVDGSPEKCSDFVRQLDEWIEQYQATPAARMELPPVSERPAQTPKATGETPPLDRSRQITPGPDRANASVAAAAGNGKRLAIVAAAAAVLLLTFLLGYLWQGSGRGETGFAEAKPGDSAIANNQLPDLRTSEREASTNVSQNQKPPNKGDSGKAIESIPPTPTPGAPENPDGRQGRASEGENAAADRKAPRGDSAESINQPDTGKAAAGDELAVENEAFQPPGNPAEPSVGSVPFRQPQTDSAPVIGGTWHGLPVIDPKKAADFAGEEVAVAGKVAAVGQSQSGAMQFLNFEKRDRNAFAAIVRQRNYGKFPGSLEALYLDKDVIVSGKVFLFEDRVPQIELTSEAQIQLVGAMTGPPGAPPEPRESTAGQTAPAAAGDRPAPFARFPSAVSIPEFSNDDVSRKPAQLGHIDTGDDLLGMELETAAGFARKNAVFTMDRDSTNANRWEICFAERGGDDPALIAEITKTGDELFFQWIAPEATSVNVNYLRNCLLQIKSPTDSKTCALRTPVEIEPIVFTSKKANYRESLPVEFLPEEAFVFAEIHPLAVEDFPDQNSELGYEVSAEQPATEIYFHRDALQRVLAIGFRLETGTRIRIDAVFLVNSPSGFAPYRESAFRELGESIRTLQLNTQNQKLAADNYDPPYGQKTKHKEFVKELSKALDLYNLQAEAYNVASGRISKVLDQPIHYRVLYRSGDVNIELARTKGWTEQGIDASPTENGPDNK
jgi:serine/threonine protein kinase